MSLFEMVNEACKNLPLGYIIKIGMENGAAWIELYDPNNHEIQIDSTDMTLTEQVSEALTESINHSIRKEIE